MDFEDERRESINRAVALKAAVEAMKCFRKGNFAQNELKLKALFKQCMYLLTCNPTQLDLEIAAEVIL